MPQLIPQPTIPEYYSMQNLYMAAKGLEEPPTLDELLIWLHKRGGYDYLARMRNTLDEIWNALDEIGPIDIYKNMQVAGFTILRLKNLTQRCPRRRRSKKDMVNGK